MTKRNPAPAHWTVTIVEALSSRWKVAETMPLARSRKTSPSKEALDACGITLNKNCVPGDRRPPSQTSGVRIGTPAVTTRGLRPSDMEPLARCIWLAVHDFEASRETILETVRSITARYPIYPNA